MRGGVWGGECRQQSQRRMPLACSAYSRLLTPPYPPPPQDRVYRPPSHPRGGHAPGGEGGMVGLMDGSTPQAPAPTRIASGSSAMSALEKRSLAKSSRSDSGGDRGVMGVARLRRWG